MCAELPAAVTIALFKCDKRRVVVSSDFAVLFFFRERTRNRRRRIRQKLPLRKG
jgi:hypothetical protein